MIVLVWIALNISYYGLFLWLPFVLQDREEFSIDVYLLLTLSALSPVPWVFRVDVARRAHRPQADPRRLPLPRRRVGLRVRRRRLGDRACGRAVLRRLLQPRSVGAVYPDTAELFPTPAALERVRDGRGTRQGRRDRRPVSLRRAYRLDRQHGVVAHVRRARDAARRSRRSLRARDGGQKLA